MTIRAMKQASTFHMECAVSCAIRAKPERIWALLTNDKEFPQWNSTVTSLEGPVEKGRKLAIRVPAAKGRVFRPVVSELDSPSRMVWSDGFAPMFKGVRTFTLEPKADGTTEFTMREVFSGLMLPMIKGSLPDFVPIFEAYATDLQRAAER